MMKCARNFTLRSLSGHILHFKADTPRQVPDSCIDEALSVNIIPCDGFAPEADEKAPKTVRVHAMSADLREAVLLHAIDELYREGSPKDFDGGARPKAHSISDRAGLDISATERSKLWDKYRDLKGANVDLPRPRNFDLVVDAQRMNTKTDLLSYAKELGLDAGPLAGNTLKEIKAAVITAAMRFESPKVENSVMDEE